MPKESSTGLVDSIESEKLNDFVTKRIENLRPKLLDLSRRNPLISTKLTPRSLSYVRVVDELPDVLYENLSTQKKMRFLSLPDLEEDPKDELSREFQNALSEARIEDKLWIESSDGIDPSSEENIELYQKYNRELKDRVRELLKMPPRQSGSNILMNQHAINNGISPSYDLPSLDQEHEDGRHTDKFIQTLLLPNELERKMNGLISKCKSWIQETGIHVLYGAFGYLELTDPRKNDTCFAPLVLLPVEVEKVKTRDGVQFEITGREAEGESNSVLIEKLKIEYGLEMPTYEGGSLEEYFNEINQIAPKSLNWKVRRQIVFGVFPSARIAMYHDLDTSKHSIDFNEGLCKLLAGSNSNEVSMFGDEYEVDNPEIENKVPQLVVDADSSQFSTIVDILDGKDLSVEGPPGTGKSQTIVNTIAAALGAGKKVLFVAEKAAALNVVKSRLEAVGLGEFILSLQAEKSTREQVIQSLRDRTEMVPGEQPSDLVEKIHNFRKTRSELQQYITALSDKVFNTGFTVFEVLGKGIKYSDISLKLPKELLQREIPNVVKYNKSEIDVIKEIGRSIEESYQDLGSAKSYWNGLKVTNLDKFQAEAICTAAEAAAEATRIHLNSKEQLTQTGLPLDEESQKDIGVLIDRLEGLSKLSDNLNVNLIPNFVQSDLSHIEKYIETRNHFRSSCSELQVFFDNEFFLDKLDDLDSLRLFMDSTDISSLDANTLKANLIREDDHIENLRKTINSLSPFISQIPGSVTWDSESFLKAAILITEYPDSVLSIRSEPTAEPAAYSLIEKFCQEGQQLLREKRKLEENLHLSRCKISSEQLLNHLTALKTANLFSIVLPDYRKAKNFITSISKDHSYSKERAIEHLSDLLEWQSKQRAFISNKQANELFGRNLSLDTDFDLHLKLIYFYKRIDNELQGITNLTLRKFLKTADIELLKAIPKADFGDFKGSFEELKDEIDHLVRLKDSNERVLKQFEDLVKKTSLLKPAELSLSDLNKIVNQLDSLKNLNSKLQNDKVFKEVLGDKFEQADFDEADFKEEICAAGIIKSLDKHSSSVLQLVNDGKINAVLTLVLDYKQKLQTAQDSLSNLSEQTGISVPLIISSADQSELPIFLKSASEDSHGLYAHSRYETVLDDLRKHELDWIAEILIKENQDLSGLDAVIEATIFRSLAREVYKKHKTVLSKYNGATIETYRNRLANLDRSIIELSRRSLRHKLHKEANPPRGIGQGRKSEWTNLALIENELTKKKRFISVRELTHRACNALVELKPCWMMSPLAVAQYLRKGDVKFDLLIIDEASQMPPEDALGAIIRTKQSMVVGDTNQLPPSSFFRKMIDEEDADEDETVLEESVLEMANAAFRPKRRLRWHYRSRHSGLINFSNHMIYNDDLIVFPSASEDRADMGVSLISVTDGRYSSGINGTEAKAMVDETMKFMKDFPKRSLGLVTLNQKQRDLLQEEMEYAISKNPHATRYIDYWLEENDGLEQFFIKNLENVQGDERDAIFIGTVYGPEKPGGPVMQRFGPINGVAGRRRLNVLFSRAKKQIVTFSSMSSKDIKTDESGNPGVYMFKRWLEYSASGQIYSGINTRRAPDSEFEEFVIDQIKAIGCEPVPQVGVAGYFIDIGIKHPDWPFGYLMGVECDGASYHSSKSARDRDRLREEVLNGLGWHLHRIWSTDWFNDPRHQSNLLREAIIKRLSDLKENSVEYKTAAESNLDNSEDDEFDQSSDDSDFDDENGNEDTKRAEEVTSTEITDSILVVLENLPNNSCTVDSLTPRVLKHIGIITRGKPRAKFRSRVLQCLRNLVYKEVVEKYKAKNERIRLIGDSKQ